MSLPPSSPAPQIHYTPTMPLRPPATHTGPATDPARLAIRLRWATAGLILCFGIFAWDRDSTFWATVSIGLFILPLALQATPFPRFRLVALWSGIFLVVQSLVAPLATNDYVTLLPNMRSTVDIRTDDIPGMPRGLRQVTTDARGFRVAPPVDYKAKRGLRIIAIGGSTTEDILLDDRATWTHLLQASLEADGVEAEVINTGVSGLRAVNHLATLRAVAALNPDIILLLVGGNDWNRQVTAAFETESPGPPRPVLRDTPFGRLLGGAVVRPLRSWLLGTTSSDFALVIQDEADLNQDRVKSAERTVRMAFDAEGPDSTYRRDLDALSAECRPMAVPCMLITQPHAYSPDAPAELVARFWMTPPFAEYTVDVSAMARLASLYNAHLLAVARRDGLPSCDLAAAMPPEPRYFYDDMHYTDEGARLAAGVIRRCLSAFLPPAAGG